MDLLLLAIRIGLAGVLLVASVGKLLDLKNPAGREAMEAFGVPPGLAPVAAIALPVVEMVLGILLLPMATAWWAGLGTLLLMLLFMAGIGRQMAQGNAPDCHCFGQLHSAPAGPSTLVRNGIFAAAAAILVAFGWSDPGISIGGWFADRSGAEVALLVVGVVGLGAIAVLTWSILQLMSQAGRLLSRIEALEGGMGIEPETSANAAKAGEPGDLALGSIAPDFALPDLAGQTVSLASLREGNIPVMLVFTSPSCTACTRLMPEIARWQQESGQRLRTVVVTRGDSTVNAVKAKDSGVTGVLLQQDPDVSRAYGASSTPSAIVVMPDGRIGSPLARGATAVRALADAQLSGVTVPLPPVAPAQPSAASAPTLTLAPPISLPALDGAQTSLATLGVGSRPTVLVFTDPNCGPCEELLPELVAWQRRVGNRAQLALISRGDAGANRKVAQDYGIDPTIPILLQQDMEAIAAYGILQAPAAVLVTREGRWDGTPAYGAPAVRAVLERAISPEGSANGAVRANGTTPPARENPRPEIAEGDSVPAITLPDLAGSSSPLIDPAQDGSDHVLLFWRANCGYCQRMLPQLKEWEAARSAGSPELTVISTSEVPEMIAQGFASRVLLDHGVGVSRRFGSRGTPSAVRVNAEGTVVTPIVSGAQAVLQLFGDTTPRDTSAAPSASLG